MTIATETTVDRADLDERHADPPGSRRAAEYRKRPPLSPYDVLQFAPLLAMVPVGAAAVHLAVKPRSWSRGARWALGITAALGGLNLVRWQLDRLLTRTPRYRVLRREGEVELREYPEHVVAETLALADFDAALDEGFDRLAGYIYGDNAARERVGMTTPVVSWEEDIPMTAPVTNLPTTGGHAIAFVMPEGRTVDDLPRPKDVRIHLRTVPARLVAALRFTGTYDGTHVARRKGELMAAVAERGLTPVGPPQFAGYDAPATLPILRRNEVWVEVTETQA